MKDRCYSECATFCAAGTRNSLVAQVAVTGNIHYCYLSEVKIQNIKLNLNFKNVFYISSVCGSCTQRVKRPVTPDTVNGTTFPFPSGIPEHVEYQ